MKLLWYFISAVFLLSACHKDDDDELKTERSILVYIAGDNNLAGYVSNDISQIVSGSLSLSPEKNRLLAFVDKRNSTPYIVEIAQGEETIVKTFDEEINSGDENSLKMAMQWMVDNYPAKSYGLVLWGHASGWIIEGSRSMHPNRAYGVDYTAASAWMNIPEMAQALSTLPRLKFIFADCCCFQCVESAYELRNCTDYIIASPAEIPGEGAPYDKVIPALFSQSNNFYESVVDAYFDQRSGGYSLPLSVVKTSEMDNLAQATKATLASFVPSLDDGGRYPNVKDLIYYYDHTQFDMQDFMLRYADSNQYAQWKQAFDKAVIYKKMATVWMANHVRYKGYFDHNTFMDFTVTEDRFGGLGMYVPQQASSITAAEYQPKRLTFSIDRLNTSIRKMQWYNAAGLNEIGW